MSDIPTKADDLHYTAVTNSDVSRKKRTKQCNNIAVLVKAGEPCKGMCRGDFKTYPETTVACMHAGLGYISHARFLWAVLDSPCFVSIHSFIHWYP